MQKLRTVSAGIITLILIATGISPMFAQSDAARLQGIITDQSSALVPGAKVQVTDLSTNRVLETTSAPDSGAWSFPVLPPGNYVLQVSMDGFKPIKQNVTLQVAQVANVNFVLEPGGVSEQLVVTADAALVDSASSDIGTTVETRQIKDLPLNGRNFTQLATLIPGVNRGVPGNVASGQGNNAETFRYGTSNGASLVVNGARPQANNFTLDGLDNNESMVNTIVFFPSAEAIEEFKVQTNIAPAEFGRAGGAIVNTTLKSGSNEIHGSAFEFIRNDNVDARPTFAPGISEFRRNQFGGAIGSPIIKNKLFVFGDYQGFRQSTPVGVDFASVPTTLMRQGNFSELLNAAAAGLSQPYVIRNVSTGAPFAGNIIPSNLQNPVGLNYLKAFPMPNIAGKVQQNYAVQRQQTQNFDDFDVRADWNATQGDRFFARASYAHDKEDTSTRLPGLPAGYGSGSQFTYAHGGALGYTHTFTPALFSDLRLGFQRTNMGYLPPYSDVPLSKNMGIPNANTSSLLGGGALIGGYNSQLEYTGDYGNYQVPENTFQGAGSLSWAKGNHLFKFGANVIRREVNLFRPKAGKGYFDLWGNGVGPGSTGYETADVLAGYVQNYQIGAQTGMFGTRSWENAIFVQDDWRITPPSHAEYGRSLRRPHQSDRSRRTTVQLRPSDGLAPGCQRQSGSAGQQQLPQHRPARWFRVRRHRQGEDRGARRLRYLLFPGPRRHRQPALAERAVQRHQPVQLQRRVPHHVIGASPAAVQLDDRLGSPSGGWLHRPQPHEPAEYQRGSNKARQRRHPMTEQWSLQVQHQLPQRVVVSAGVCWRCRASPDRSLQHRQPAIQYSRRHASLSGNGQCRRRRRAGQLDLPLATGGGVAPVL